MSEYIAKLILAHGAGAGSDSPFMQDMAKLLVARKIETVLFDFDYMQVIKETGKKRPPEKLPKLQAQWHQQIEAVLNAQSIPLKSTLDAVPQHDLPLFIGGKSMGGRVASTIFPETPAKGCICLGYPFHPPGKPEKLRAEHLLTMDKPLLVVQGERDTFGNKEEVARYALPQSVSVHYLMDGDHSFKPRKASGVTLAENMAEAADTIAAFIQSHL